MNFNELRRDYSRVTSTIVGSIVESLREPDFDLDEGIVRLLDHDEKCVWFRLFESDLQEFDSEMALATWTVEVSLID